MVELTSSKHVLRLQPRRDGGFRVDLPLGSWKFSQERIGTEGPHRMQSDSCVVCLVCSDLCKELKGWGLFDAVFSAEHEISAGTNDVRLPTARVFFIILGSDCGLSCPTRNESQPQFGVHLSQSSPPDT